MAGKANTSVRAVKPPKTPKKMKKFPTFPQEIRDIVWKSALPGPRVVSVHTMCFTTTTEHKTNKKDNSYTIATSYKFGLRFIANKAYMELGMLYACKESHAIVLKAYPIVLPVLDPKLELRLCPEDAISIMDIGTFLKDMTKVLDNGLALPSFLGNLRTVAFVGDKGDSDLQNLVLEEFSRVFFGTFKGVETLLRVMKASRLPKRGNLGGFVEASDLGLSENIKNQIDMAWNLGEMEKLKKEPELKTLAPPKKKTAEVIEEEDDE